MYTEDLNFPEDERASRDYQQSESGNPNTWPALLGIKVMARPPGHVHTSCPRKRYSLPVAPLALVAGPLMSWGRVAKKTSFPTHALGVPECRV